jgi:hypothetical protein
MITVTSKVYWNTYQQTGDARWHVHKKDGTWSNAFTHSSNGGTAGGIYGVGDEDILGAGGAGFYWWWDGSTWNEHQASVTTTDGVWGMLLDSNPPVVTPVTPAAGAINVDKAAPIKFTVVDNETSVVLSTVNIYVRGLLVFDGSNFASDWSESTYADLGGVGYLFTLIPKRVVYARPNVVTGIRVVAADELANSVNESWSFTAKTDLNISTYRFILESVRRRDE